MLNARVFQHTVRVSQFNPPLPIFTSEVVDKKKKLVVDAYLYSLWINAVWTTLGCCAAAAAPMAWLGPLLPDAFSPFAPLPAPGPARSRSLSGLERAGGAGAAMEVADEVETSMGSTGWDERSGCTGERGTGLAEVTDEESTGILRVEPGPWVVTVEAKETLGGSARPLMSPLRGSKKRTQKIERGGKRRRRTRRRDDSRYIR